MRGLVMEVKGNNLVVLTSQGKYIRIKNEGTSAIGDYVSYDSPAAMQIRWVPRNMIALAASLLLICTVGLGTYGYSQPFGIVNIDINPSMALTYNWFKQVIAVEALNPDGEKLLPELGSIKNKNITVAVQAVVAAASKAGYLKPELDNVVFISVSDSNRSGRNTALLNKIKQNLSEISTETESVLLVGTPETYKKLKKDHESPAKELVESSQDRVEENDDDDPLVYSTKPLEEIIKKQELKKHKLLKPKDTEHFISPEVTENDDKPGRDRENNNPSQNPDNNRNNAPNNNTDNDESDRNDTVEPNTPDDEAHEENNPEFRKSEPGRNNPNKPESREQDPDDDND